MTKFNFSENLPSTQSRKIKRALRKAAVAPKVAPILTSNTPSTDPKIAPAARVSIVAPGNEKETVKKLKDIRNEFYQVKNKVKKPSLYKVLILNDDYTPMEFVIYLLKSFFNKSNEEATKIMLHVHQNGIGVCGVFSYEIAETKVIQVLDTSRKNNHPLQCTMEKA